MSSLTYDAAWSPRLSHAVGIEPETYHAASDRYRRSVPILPGETRKFLRLEVHE